MPSPAFPYTTGTSNEGPNLAAGDLNNDGKADLVLSTGAAISTWIGNGDGTFTRGNSYASVNDTGYVSVTDLDGDGNADIYIGLADGGIFSGDDSNPSLNYVLMGNGDGTFQGAPLAPGAYTGNNLVDLNGDGIPDLVTSASTGGLTVWLGNGKGIFVSKSTITAPSNFVINGYTFNGADKSSPSSFAVGDVNGDGKPDIVFVTNYLTAINPGSATPITYSYPVYFVALGNGDGTFQAATPYAFPQIAPPANFDNQLAVSSLQVADFNKDGHADLIFVYNDIAGGSGVNPYLQGFVVLTGAGNGTFATTAVLTSTYNSATAPTTPATDQITQVQDLNGDGVLDLVVAVPSFSIATGPVRQLQIFIAKGDGTFKTPFTVTVSANTFGLPVLADFNGDGKADLSFITEDASSQAGFAIALGNGDGTFASATISNLTGGDAIRSAGLAGADFNGDGKVDLALFDTQGYSGIFYGQGDGTFTSVPETGYLVPKDLINLASGAPAIAVDLNKDGKPDIVAGNVVFLSQAAPTVTTPAVTTTTLVASPTTAAVGTSVTFTATVASSSGSGTPTGTVIFYDGSTALATQTLASGTATYSTSSLTVGTHSITAQYSGDTNYAASSSTALSFIVTAVSSPMNTSTVLTASPTSGITGASISLSATVTPASGTAVPAGTVTFLDGSTALGSQNLSASGVGTFSTSSLAVGIHTITAQYSGNANFKASTSPAVTVTISAPVPDFSLSITPTNGTESSTSPSTATITVTPTNGFNSTISFACSGLPSGLSCSFSPSTLTPAGAAITTSVSISGTLSAQSNSARMSPIVPLQLCGFGLGLLVLARMRRCRRFFTMLSVLAFSLAALSGCGSSDSKKNNPQSASVTITATAGSTSHSTPYALTINP